MSRFNPNRDCDGSGITNDFRADRAAGAVIEWLDDDAADTLPNGSIDFTTHIQDLLCDLMHLCDREQIDFHRLLAVAQPMHEDER